MVAGCTVLVICQNSRTIDPRWLPLGFRLEPLVASIDHVAAWKCLSIETSQTVTRPADMRKRLVEHCFLAKKKKNSKIFQSSLAGFEMFKSTLWDLSTRETLKALGDGFH